MIFKFLFSAESPIGRFDASMLTDHQMMELFFTPEDTDTLQRYNALYFDFDDCGRDDACTWLGVTCSSKGHVVEIEWKERDVVVCGSIDFSKLPRCVKTVYLVAEALYGEVDTSVLPRSLESFKLQNCEFTGSLDMRILPPHLKSYMSKATLSQQ